MPSPTPRIAVVIPVFNRHRMILECLESVANQTRTPDVVVVVDDGSTDGSGRAIEDWIARQGDGDRFRLLTLPESKGAARARNRGMDFTGASNFIAFLDSDDLWPGDFLARAETSLAADSAAVAASADIRIERPGKDPVVRHLSSLESNVIDVLFRDAGIGSATLLRTDAVRAAGSYNESLGSGHDIVLYFAVSALGPWRHIAGEPVVKRHGSKAPGEAGSLASRYADRHSRWAEIYERVIQEHGERLGIGAPRRARMIARRWYRAGDAMIRQRDTSAARTCLRNAIRWRPASVRARLKLLGTYLP